jgi:hypothetical protein
MLFLISSIFAMFGLWQLFQILKRRTHLQFNVHLDRGRFLFSTLLMQALTFVGTYATFTLKDVLWTLGVLLLISALAVLSLSGYRVGRKTSAKTAMEYIAVCLLFAFFFNLATIIALNAMGAGPRHVTSVAVVNWVAELILH